MLQTSFDKIVTNSIIVPDHLTLFFCNCLSPLFHQIWLGGHQGVSSTMPILQIYYSSDTDFSSRKFEQ